LLLEGWIMDALNLDGEIRGYKFNGWGVTPVGAWDYRVLEKIAVRLAALRLLNLDGETDLRPPWLFV